MNMRSLALNPEQKRAAERVLTQNREGGGTILLTGAPGTGKTTIAGYVSSRVSSRAVGLALTSQAAYVLGKALGRRAYTLQQWVGAEADGYNATGERTFSYGQRPADLPTPGLIMLDDVSIQAPTESLTLLDLVLDYAKEHGICVLLTADPDLSMLRTPNRPPAFWADLPTVHLERNERTRQPELLQLSAHLRERLHKTHPIDGLTPHWNKDRMTGWQFVQAGDLPRISAALEDAAIIAFSDEAVERHNRNAIQIQKGRAGIPPFDEGDILVAYQNRQPLNTDPFTFRVTDSWRYLVLARRERSQHHSIPGYWVTLHGLEDETTFEVFLVPCHEALAAKMFARQCERRFRLAKEATESTGQDGHWAAFHHWRDHFLLLGNAANAPYARKDLDFANCLPEGKTQGSTYDYALIDDHDLEKIRQDKGTETANRMLYASVCRARKGVLIGR